MTKTEAAERLDPVGERRLHLAAPPPDVPARTRTIVLRQGSGWQSLAVLFLCLLLLGVVLAGQHVLRAIDARHEQQAAEMAGARRKIQQLEAGLSYDGARRQLVLGMRDHILKVNPRVSLADAFLYAELAVDASEKYPSVDPLLLLAIGSVESGYDPLARSRADARGLYQIWPSTGRLLARSLGWDYDEQTLFEPRRNTEAAALYLDILFSAYNDPQMVLAEYNGGPLNAGYYRASAASLSPETRSYVPRVLELYERLKGQFDTGAALQRDARGGEQPREGKALGARTSGQRAAAGTSATAAANAAPASPARTLAR
jgi:hypothetical protein